MIKTNCNKGCCTKNKARKIDSETDKNKINRPRIMLAEFNFLKCTPRSIQCLIFYTYYEDHTEHNLTTQLNAHDVQKDSKYNIRIHLFYKFLH